MEIIATIVPLILTNNIILSGVKWLNVRSMTKWWFRGLLAALSLVGVVATGALTGNPVDPNQVSDLVVLVSTTFLTGVGSHFSYKVIKYA